MPTHFSNERILNTTFQQKHFRKYINNTDLKPKTEGTEQEKQIKIIEIN